MANYSEDYDSKGFTKKAAKKPTYKEMTEADLDQIEVEEIDADDFVEVSKPVAEPADFFTVDAGEVIGASGSVITGTLKGTLPPFPLTSTSGSSVTYHQHFGTSAPKKGPLEYCRFARYTNAEGLVIQVDGQDFTLEDAYDVDIVPGTGPGTPSYIEFKIMLPKMEVYNP